MKGKKYVSRASFGVLSSVIAHKDMPQQFMDNEAGNPCVLFRLLKDSISCGVLLVDGQEIIQHSNPVMSHITGLSKEKLSGAHLQSVFQGSSGQLFISCYHKAKTTQRPVDLESFFLITPQGRRVCLSCKFIPISVEGDFERVLCLIDDITDIFHVRNELKRISSLTEGSPLPILQASKDGTVVYANPMGKELLGQWGVAVGRCLPEGCLSALGLAFDNDTTQTAEYVADGQVFRLTLNPLPTGFVDIYVQDVSNMVQCEMLRGSCELRFRSLVDNASDWIWEVDENGVYVFSSPRVQHILGYSPEEVLGKKPIDFMPAQEARRVAKIFAEHASARQPLVNFENVNNHKNGYEVVLATSGEPIVDSEGRFRGFRGVDKDVSERKKIVQSLQNIQLKEECKIDDRTRDLKLEVSKLQAEVCERRRIQSELVQSNIDRDRFRSELEAVFQSLPDAVLTVDHNMRIINYNKSLAKFCSRTEEITSGKPLPMLFENDNMPCARALEATRCSRTPVKSYRTECSCGVKPDQVVLLNASPLINENNEFMGAILIVRDISRLDQLERRVEERTQYRNIIGKSDKMQEIYSLLKKLQDLDTTVLITGESGTGKELIVEALHYSSSRFTGPLVKVNCSALSENLLESELFGHVRGAFTGAVHDKIGRFQMAEGGTIFLDEIGDISPNIQRKLLRILERKEYERVGDSNTLKAKVRLMAATNVNLEEKVRLGEFRPDLYYRLKVMVIELPPLRERSEDISILTDHFIDHYSHAFNKQIVGVENEVMNLFMQYPWPGNIRELKHTIEHACILCSDTIIRMYDMPQSLIKHTNLRIIMQETAPDDSQSIRGNLVHVLEKTHWNKSKAAKMLGISRTTLYRKMSEMGIL